MKGNRCTIVAIIIFLVCACRGSPLLHVRRDASDYCRIGHYQINLELRSRANQRFGTAGVVSILTWIGTIAGIVLSWPTAATFNYFDRRAAVEKLEQHFCAPDPKPFKVIPAQNDFRSG